MKTVTKLDIPDNFDENIIQLVKQAVARAKVQSRVICNQDTHYLLKHIRIELEIAYNIGVKQGMIEALAALREELG